MATNKRRKASVMTLGAVMATATLVPAVSASAKMTFPDVAEDHEAYQEVKDLVRAGVVNGYEDGTFKPEQSVIRSEAAKMLAVIRGMEGAEGHAPFSDINEGSWYADAVHALYADGVIHGYEDGTFGPNETMLRSEFAKLVVEAYDMEIVRTELPFKDVAENKWYAPYIETLYANGLIKGTSETTFSPNDEMRRIDFALLLANADYKFGDKLPKPTFELSVMHTNDTHANLDNAAKKVTAVKEVREEKPHALLVDAGDVMSGTLYFNEFQGMADLQFMNLMGYDVMTFGNHEFDLGSSEEGHQALKDFVEAAQFPFVSANVDFSKDEKFTGLFSDTVSSDPDNGKIYQGIVKEIEGENVGIFGLTTAETVDLSSPGAIEFEDYIEEAEKAVKAFEKQGIDKIIAVTHIGYDDNVAVDNDQALAQEVDGIDLIVGGHTHTKLDEPVIVTEDDHGVEKDPTVIVQAYQYNDYLGTVDVQFNENGVVIGAAGELIEVGEKEEDPEAAEMLEKYQSAVIEVSEQEIGAIAMEALVNPRVSDEGNDGKSVRNSETPLGNLITDGMLAKAKEYNEDVVMAMQNGGGIRAGIDQGPITVGEVITVLPFGNTLATVEVTGAELKEVFETSFKEYPAESGGFLHIAGGVVEYDSSQPAGERIVSISIEKEDGTLTEVEDDQTYTIATNAFTAKGGDGYTTLAKAYEEGRVTDLGLSDWGNFAEHLASIGEIVPEVEERLVDVAK
ncbi:S-layer homology domain-containing protein [Oceanobacillus senegalensis]|uniref:S-layer homology domain-containing protein n=1 Tax=Oceanobacillus senegalensis TaxID=1936063 RepID=UPI000A30CB7E|nr:5'-nucleotidase C-terminal domain-containing protein [Oceanobacillus senegalensis]